MTDRNPTVVVTSYETLPEIVERLREAADGGHTVDLVVPIDSALLLTAREFRVLKDAIDNDRIALLLRTSDPLRLQLAERLGIPARALPRPRVVVEPAPVVLAPPRIVPQPPMVGGDDWPGDTAIAEPVLRPDPESHWPSQNGSADSGPDGDLNAEPDTEIDPERTSQNPPRRWLPVAIRAGRACCHGHPRDPFRRATSSDYYRPSICPGGGVSRVRRDDRWATD